MRSYIIFLFALLLVACTNQKIDSSSPEKLTSSVQEISDKLNETKRQQFKRALYYISFKTLELEKFNTYDFDRDIFTSDFLLPIRDKIDQKSADELISDALEIQRKLRHKRVKKRQKQISELKKKLEEQKPENVFIEDKIKLLKNSPILIPESDDSLGILPTITVVETY